MIVYFFNEKLYTLLFYDNKQIGKVFFAKISSANTHPYCGYKDTNFGFFLILLSITKANPHAFSTKHERRQISGNKRRLE
jgi:hypothetical protein